MGTDTEAGESKMAVATHGQVTSSTQRIGINGMGWVGMGYSANGWVFTSYVVERVVAVCICGWLFAGVWGRGTSSSSLFLTFPRSGVRAWGSSSWGCGEVEAWGREGGDGSL